MPFWFPKNTLTHMSIAFHIFPKVTPESITRDLIESFEEIGTGKWRIVYIQDYSTSFGFGSLFGDISAAEVELYSGIITSKCTFACVEHSKSILGEE